MGLSQSKPKPRASAVEQPPSLPNGHLQMQANRSSLVSLSMEPAQREGSVRQSRSLENQGPGTSTEPRDPLSPVDSHGTYTAIATEPDQAGYGRSWDNRYQLLLPEDKGHVALNDLYHPGDTVFKKDLDAWRAYKVKRSEFRPISHPDSILVHCYYLDFDKTGRWLVPQLAVLFVPSLSSKRSIEDLEVIPGRYFDDHHSLRRKLLERGRQYAAYAGRVFYGEYTGDSWPTTPRKDPIKVIVDYMTASRHRRDSVPALQCVESGVCSVCSGEKVQLQSYPEGAPHDADICRRHLDPALDAEQQSSDDGSLLFCPPKLWAFSLGHKCWKMILPEHLTAVQPREDAIDKLWMLRNHKTSLELMLSHLDAEKVKRSHGTKRGKGQGLNILLTGNSGTGKTFTVETLAEKRGVPLYKIACGDLGSNPDNLESKFNEAMLRAANWGAILLLDEADIFISRDSDSLVQNVLVSILLRQLERSDCVFFMTTHTVHEMLDEAVRSRLHLTLRLPDLTLEGQRSIWSGCIRDIENLSPPSKQALDHFIKNDLEVMDNRAFTKLNGRQIRNCVTAALAVALSHETTLKPEHIETMLRLGKEFRDSVSRRPRDPAAALGMQNQANGL
ncbi:P-loop containing nucleoside triphosphate hydrolase protein [Hypoxylon sp. FL0543]|nr:P-loop containing nucleoside triphosphate hydrolase protein [Hypoxylon sp. FL0543]